MSKTRDQALVDSISRELIGKLKLKMYTDGALKESVFEIGGETIGHGQGSFCPADLGNVEEVMDAVVDKVNWLRSATLGQIVDTGVSAKSPTLTETFMTKMTEVSHLAPKQLKVDLEDRGHNILRALARVVLVARIYDLLTTDMEPWVTDVPDLDEPR